MKFSGILPVLFVASIITSCGSSSSDESSTPATNTTSTPAVTTPVTTNSQPTSTQTIQTQPSVNATVPVPNIPQGTVPVSGKAGLNPAHGQPGHRCDIAVGAPLDSKPAAQTITTTPQPVANAQPVTVSNPITINNPAATPGARPKPVAAGMNPEHGQPGHHCDIAVGAPLNSPSNVATPAPSPSIAPAAATGTQQAVIKPTPVTLTNPPQTGTAANGLNPKHGEPGHRCDIAVGAPLNSKPGQ